MCSMSKLPYEIAMLGMPAASPSIAAETVPEYNTASPMFGPWFTPEITQFGPWGISAPRASSTQSVGVPSTWKPPSERRRSEEHTSELQSLRHLVCRLLLG